MTHFSCASEALSGRVGLSVVQRFDWGGAVHSPGGVRVANELEGLTFLIFRLLAGRDGRLLSWSESDVDMIAETVEFPFLGSWVARRAANALTGPGRSEIYRSKSVKYQPFGRFSSFLLTITHDLWYSPY